jgi:hypothetical protein
MYLESHAWSTNFKQKLSCSSVLITPAKVRLPWHPHPSASQKYFRRKLQAQAQAQQLPSTRSFLWRASAEGPWLLA